MRMNWAETKLVREDKRLGSPERRRETRRWEVEMRAIARGRGGEGEREEEERVEREMRDERRERR